MRSYIINAAVIAATAAIGSTSAWACTAYEREVYEVATTVDGFRQADQFVNVYGWGTAGPYHKWLNRIRELNDDKDNALELLRSYGFIPMEIYSVADEFRTVGGLDDFYQDVDEAIRSLRCR